MLRKVLVVLGFVCVVAVLGGCSGGGSSSDPGKVTVSGGSA